MRTAGQDHATVRPATPRPRPAASWPGARRRPESPAFARPECDRAATDYWPAPAPASARGILCAISDSDWPRCTTIRAGSVGGGPRRSPAAPGRRRAACNRQALAPARGSPPRRCARTLHSRSSPSLPLHAPRRAKHRLLVHPGAILRQPRPPRAVRRAALPTAFPAIPVQRCWAHKMRNVLGKVRRADQPTVKADLQALMNAKTLPQARSAARRFADRWQPDYPKAVACLRDDLDELLTPACAGAGSAGATNPSPSANGSGPPTPSNGAFAKSDGEPGQWASFPTALRVVDRPVRPGPAIPLARGG